MSATWSWWSGSTSSAYDEAWIGEHHSAGFEIIASPEVFIAVLAERTRHIRLGTGVSSLPYHHPLILTDRMVLLDHLTRGRMMMGVGPGALPSDAFMMGIDPMTQRQMMEESLEAILALLDGSELVTREPGWFTLRDARTQLRPYSDPRFEIAVAAQISPAGPRAAGRFGLSLLSIGATSAGGFDMLGSHWKVMEERAHEFGTSVDRRKWRLVGPMHLAETEAQARADVEFGLAQWIDYFEQVAALPLAPQTLHVEEMVDADQQHRIRGRRHARDGHSPDRAAARAVRGVRDVPPHGPRMGRPRSDPSLLRVVRPRGHAEVPGIAALARIVP